MLSLLTKNCVHVICSLNMFSKYLTCKNVQVLQGRYKIRLQIIYAYFLPPWGKPITINVLYQSWGYSSPNSNDTRVGKNLKNKIPVKLWNDIWADWDKHPDVTGVRMWMWQPSTAPIVYLYNLSSYKCKRWKLRISALHKDKHLFCVIKKLNRKYKYLPFGHLTRSGKRSTSALQIQRKHLDTLDNETSKWSDICRWVSWFAIIQSAIVICLSGSTTACLNALPLRICSLGIIIWASNSNVVLVIRKCERKTSNSYTGTVTSK